MKQMNNYLREKIKIAIKNKLDISSLIKDVDIRGEDLKGAVIEYFDRPGDNISDANLSNCIIGKENVKTDLNSVKMVNTNFKGTKFLGIVSLRRADARGANFTGAYMPYCEYQYADFRNAKFCSTVITIGTMEGLKARFSKSLWDTLTKGWIFE